MELAAVVVAAVTAAFAAIGLAFAARQLRADATARRAETYRHLHERMWTDSRMRHAYDLIEATDTSLFVPLPTQRETEAERSRRQEAAEVLLAHLDLVCTMRALGLLDDADMPFFDMNIFRVVSQPDFQQYRHHITQYWQSTRAPGRRGPYDHLFNYVDERFAHGRP